MFVGQFEHVKVKPFFDLITLEKFKKEFEVICIEKKPPIRDFFEGTRYEHTGIPKLSLLPPKEPEIWFRPSEPKIKHKEYEVGKSLYESAFSILQLTE